MNCDDGNACTTDQCLPLMTGCDYSFNTDACDDGDACTSGEVCDGAGIVPERRQ